jgi:nucleotide-binding universal stress UspA family protein
MATRVLVPMDDSEMAARALEVAIETYPNAHLTVLHVAGGASPMMGHAAAIALADDPEAEAREQAADVFDRAAEIATAHDREIETIVELGSAGRAICNRAADVDAVVIGSHGGSLADQLFVGNVAKQVVRHAPVPVMVVR